MNRLCVIGDPVLHSKSPLIQNTMLTALGLEPCYTAVPVKQEALPRWLAGAPAEGYTGFNATMPHKEDLLPLLDVAAEEAALLGAVNTVCIKDGKLYGYNTDGVGFLAALGELDVTPEGKRFLLLGAGGAAKAVALTLARAGAQVTVCNRTMEKAAELCALNPAGGMTAADFAPETLTRLARGCDVLVNCTSLGMAGAGGQFDDFGFVQALPPHAVVYDVIYHPARTELLARSEARGLRGSNGLGMLVHQAIYALEYFLDRTLDHAEMAGRVRWALKQAEDRPER